METKAQESQGMCTGWQLVSEVSNSAVDYRESTLASYTIEHPCQPPMLNYS